MKWGVKVLAIFMHSLFCHILFSFLLNFYFEVNIDTLFKKMLYLNQSNKVTALFMPYWYKDFGNRMSLVPEKNISRTTRVDEEMQTLVSGCDPKIVSTFCWHFLLLAFSPLNVLSPSCLLNYSYFVLFLYLEGCRPWIKGRLWRSFKDSWCDTVS